MPDVFTEDTPLNYAMVDDMDNLEVAELEKIEHPTSDEITANKQKWGWDG